MSKVEADQRISRRGKEVASLKDQLSAFIPASPGANPDGGDPGSSETGYSFGISCDATKTYNDVTESDSEKCRIFNPLGRRTPIRSDPFPGLFSGERRFLRA